MTPLKVDYMDPKLAYERFVAYAKDLKEADGRGDYQWAVLHLFWLAEEYCRELHLNPKRIAKEGL